MSVVFNLASVLSEIPKASFRKAVNCHGRGRKTLTRFAFFLGVVAGSSKKVTIIVLPVCAAPRARLWVRAGMKCSCVRADEHVLGSCSLQSP